MNECIQISQAERDRRQEAVDYAHGQPKPEPKSLHERMEAFWRENPMPEQTGQVADKAFLMNYPAESRDRFQWRRPFRCEIKIIC